MICSPVSFKLLHNRYITKSYVHKSAIYCASYRNIIPCKPILCLKDVYAPENITYYVTNLCDAVEKYFRHKCE